MGRKVEVPSPCPASTPGLDVRCRICGTDARFSYSDWRDHNNWCEAAKAKAKAAEGKVKGKKKNKK
uniref:Uncharacterized protein n=1 Tax=Oryza glumipatula TaxID=40148 RepID=A0A0E0B2D6_9ORYZ